MAKFFKNLFSHNAISSEKKKASKSKPDLMSSEDDDREFSAPYDTRRKMSVSRSGRMKQNLKQRGALANDLYGDESKVETTHREYHVHGKNFTPLGVSPPATNGNPRNSSDRLNSPQFNQRLNSQHSEQRSNSEQRPNSQQSYDRELTENGENTSLNSRHSGKRKNKISRDEDDKFNDVTDLDKEIEKVFENVLRETSF